MRYLYWQAAGYCVVVFFIHSSPGDARYQATCNMGRDTRVSMVLEFVTSTKTEADFVEEYVKVRFDPLPVKDARAAQWTMQIIGWKLEEKALDNGDILKLTLPGTKSERDDDQEFLEKVGRARIPIFLNPDGFVERVEPPIQLLPKKGSPAEPSLRHLVSEANLSLVATLAISNFPKDLSRTKVGESWMGERHGNASKPEPWNLDSNKFRPEYRLAKTDQQCYYLTIKPSVVNVREMIEKDGALTSFYLTCAAPEGYMVIEKSNKRILTRELTIRIKGTWATKTLTGTELKGKADHFSKLTVRPLDPGPEK